MQIWTVVLVCLGAVAEIPATPQDTSHPPPWAWTETDRIRVRFDAESIRMRTEQAKSHVRRAEPGSIPIDGRINPELFFPWELLDSFLQIFDASPAQIPRIQNMYRRAIKSGGWDFDNFWLIVERESSAYVMGKRELVELQRAARRRGEVHRSQTRSPLCSVRWSTLTALEVALGKVAFNRFLYTAVAPDLKMWTTSKRDAEVLKYVAGGCK